MIDAVKYAERRKDLRRKSDRQFIVSIGAMFLLVGLLGFSFGYYLASKQAMELIQSYAPDTRGASTSHRGPDVEK